MKKASITWQTKSKERSRKKRMTKTKLRRKTRRNPRLWRRQPHVNTRISARGCRGRTRLRQRRTRVKMVYSYIMVLVSYLKSFSTTLSQILRVYRAGFLQRSGIYLLFYWHICIVTSWKSCTSYSTTGYNRYNTFVLSLHLIIYQHLCFFLISEHQITA